MNINFYQNQPYTDNNNLGGGCPTGYPPQFSNTSESYLCSGQAMNDKFEQELDKERRIAQSRTSYDDMPDFIKQNYVGPKYGTQEYQQEMYEKYGDKAPNYIKPEKVQKMIQNDYSYPEPRPYVPGMNGPIECTKCDGSVDYINTSNMGGFEPIAPKYNNPINQYATDSLDKRRIEEAQSLPVYDQVMGDPYHQQDLYGQPIMPPPQPDPYIMQQQPFTYDQYGNMVPVQQGPQFTYDQYGNMIPLQMPQEYVFDQFGNAIPIQPQQYQPYIQNPYMQQQAMKDINYVQSGTATYTNGFNPYGNNMSTSTTGNAYLDYMNNSNNTPFMTTVRNPYTGASITYNLRPYIQTPFDNEIREIIYNMDIDHYMEDIPYNMLISDEERRVNEQKRREDEAVSIYNMTYGLPTMQQYNMYRSEFEQFKNDTCDLFSKLHKINNYYFGKEYTEEEDKIVRDMHNPLKDLEAAMERNKKQYGFGINYGKLSPSEIKDMKELQEVRQMNRIAAELDRETEYYQPIRNQVRAAIYKKIKDSHDQLLGVKPGEHYNLDYFLNHGHELVRNAYMSGIVSKVRAEKFKRYNPDRFKTTIYNHTEEAQRDGIRPEFLNAKPVMLVEGEFSEDKQRILKNLYDRSGSHIVEIRGVPVNQNIKKDQYRFSVDDDESKSLVEVHEPTVYERRMKQYKEGVDDLVDQFHQIQAVYGDRRGKRWWK